MATAGKPLGACVACIAQRSSRHPCYPLNRQELRELKQIKTRLPKKPSWASIALVRTYCVVERNPPSFAVALNCGIGSSSLNAISASRFRKRPFRVPRDELMTALGALGPPLGGLVTWSAGAARPSIRPFQP